MAENFPSDDFFMARAIELAMKGKGHTRPNPAVGAVIVKGGRIIGEGWHKRAGGDHAEVAAIKNALESGATTLEGATIYVTLEPCSRPGRVGACTDAIKAAGLSEAVYAVSDPNPVNADRAAKVLLASGVKCRKASCSIAIIAEAEELVADFAKHVTTGMPYVTVKIAMTLDGKICDFKGDAKWISSADARRKTHDGRFQDTADAVACFLGCQDRCLHIVGSHFIQSGEQALGKRLNICLEIPEFAVRHTGAAENMGANVNALFLQGAVANSAGCYQSCRDAAGEMTAATGILIAVIFALSRIICVTGTHQPCHIGIVAAFGVLVEDHQGQGRAGGDAVHSAAENLHLIGLFSGGRNCAARLPQLQHPSDIFHVNGRAGAKTVQHSADGRTVALAKEGHRYMLTKCIFHESYTSRKNV